MVSVHSGEAFGWDLSPVGKVLKGTYRIDDMVNQGGMSWLYRATHLALEELVAVKLLFPQLLQEPTTYKRFLDEAKIQFKLRHSNIVQVTDLIADENFAGIVMEWVEGLSLKEYLLQRKELLSLSEIYACIRPLLNALQYSHEQGVVHRDIKPGNILLVRSSTKPGLTPKLSDFGVAKILNDFRDRTATGMALGTFKYISPEQIRDSKTVDHRADIYGVGIILYQLMTGRLPFEGGMERMLFDHVYTKPVSPAHFNPHLSRELCDIVMHCLGKNPDERFQSCLALGQALESIMPTHGSLKWQPNMQAPSREIYRSLSRSHRSLNAANDSHSRPPSQGYSPNSSFALPGLEAQIPQAPVSSRKSDYHTTHSPNAPVLDEQGNWMEDAKQQFNESGSWIGFSVMDMLKECTTENKPNTKLNFDLRKSFIPSIIPKHRENPGASLELDRILSSEAEAPKDQDQVLRFKSGPLSPILDDVADQEIERSINALAYYQSETELEETSIIAPENNLAEWVEASDGLVKRTPVPEQQVMKDTDLGRNLIPSKETAEEKAAAQGKEKAEWNIQSIQGMQSQVTQTSLPSSASNPANPIKVMPKNGSAGRVDEAIHAVSLNSSYPTPQPLLEPPEMPQGTNTTFEYNQIVGRKETPSQQDAVLKTDKSSVLSLENLHSAHSQPNTLREETDRALSQQLDEALRTAEQQLARFPMVIHKSSSPVLESDEPVAFTEVEYMRMEDLQQLSTSKKGSSLENRLLLYLMVFLGIFSITLGVLHLLS